MLVAIRQLASHAEKNQDVLNKDPAQPTQIKMYFSDSSYLADLLQFVQYTIVHLSTFFIWAPTRSAFPSSHPTNRSPKIAKTDENVATSDWK